MCSLQLDALVVGLGTRAEFRQFVVEVPLKRCSLDVDGIFACDILDTPHGSHLRGLCLVPPALVESFHVLDSRGSVLLPRGGHVPTWSLESSHPRPKSPVSQLLVVLLAVPLF